VIKVLYLKITHKYNSLNNLEETVQVKIFTGGEGVLLDSKDLQNEINNWLQKHPNVKIVDKTIKATIFPAREVTPPKLIYTVFVWYEPAKSK
jgi:hypothetical protein